MEYDIRIVIANIRVLVNVVSEILKLHVCLDPLDDRAIKHDYLIV